MHYQTCYQPGMSVWQVTCMTPHTIAAHMIVSKFLVDLDGNPKLLSFPEREVLVGRVVYTTSDQKSALRRARRLIAVHTGRAQLRMAA